MANSTSKPVGQPAKADPTSQPKRKKPALDDIMIAMDVVDTLRHDDRIVARELNDAARRSNLIKRLREIYAGQGLEVPDRILEEGVKALEEDRFVYTPQPPGVYRGLAEWYVTRWQWGRYALGAVGAIVLLLAANYIFVQRPNALARQAAVIERNETLPKAFQTLPQSISTEARDDQVIAEARTLATSGVNALKSDDLAAARAARDQLQTMLSDLRSDYEIRIVSRSGELTGLWRVPKANPETYNFYLVVEAIDRSGAVIPQTVLNEETGKRDTVRTWAVRVPRDVLTAVEQDKRDDGIIQNAVVGRKVRGQVRRSWSIPVSGGFITRW